MWDLEGLELTGRYGNWFERTYEIIEGWYGTVALVMSAEQSPGPEWERCVPDVFYGEGIRWTRHVPAGQVTGVHSTVAQGVIGGACVDLLAQRGDGRWAVSSDGKTVDHLVRMGMTMEDGLWNGWVPQRDVTAITRASYIPYPEAS